MTRQVLRRPHTAGPTFTTTPGNQPVSLRDHPQTTLPASSGPYLDDGTDRGDGYERHERAIDSAHHLVQTPVTHQLGSSIVTPSGRLRGDPFFSRQTPMPEEPHLLGLAVGHSDGIQNAEISYQRSMERSTGYDREDLPARSGAERIADPDVARPAQIKFAHSFASCINSD